MKRKYETSEKYNARIIKLVKPKALETLFDANAKNRYDGDIESEMGGCSAGVKFYESNFNGRGKCLLYAGNEELIAQCYMGDIVIFDCQEPIEVSVCIKGYYGKPKTIIEPGDVLGIKSNLIGKIRFIDDDNKYRKWLATIDKIRLVDSKDEAPKVTTKQSGVSTAARAVLGGALLGDLGAIAGAASTKRKTTITQGKRTYKFYVLYKDGTDDILVLAEGEKCDDLLKLSYRQEK